MPVRNGFEQAPETAMLSDFLQSLVRHAQTLDDPHDGALARTLIELLPTALGGPPRAGGIFGVEFEGLAQAHGLGRCGDAGPAF